MTEETTHKPYWSVAVYGDEKATSPQYSSEHEARQAFRNPALFVESALPESYAVVLWQCTSEGQQSALTSQVVSLPVTAPEAWSPSF